MTSIQAVALALLALQEDPAAFCSKLEETYAAAKTLVVKAQIDGETVVRDVPQRFAFHAEARFKEGNRVRLTLGASETPTYTLVCDGTRAEHRSADLPHVHDAAADFAARLRRIVLRAGLSGALHCADGHTELPEIATSQHKFLAPEKVGDRQARVLEFTSTMKRGKVDVVLSRKLFVDPESMALLKDETRDGSKTTITEAISDLRFEADLPDREFTLNEGK